MRGIVLLALAASLAFADTKSEADLKARLAAAEIEKAEMMRQLGARATADKAAATGRAAAIVGREDAAIEASAARESRDVNAAIAQNAVTVATQTALKAAEAAGEVRGQIIALLITTIAGFLSLIAQQYFKTQSEIRARKWALEDSAAHRAILLGKIEAVKNEAHAAYQEANNVGEKLKAIGVQVRDSNKGPKEAPKL